MRILIVHNYYKQPGGEDQVFRSEVELLRSRGHDVFTLEATNDEIPDEPSIKDSLTIARDTVWSSKGYRLVYEAVTGNSIDIVHFHNTFTRVSPAAYWAAKKAGARVVQTLHNYRLFCLNAQFYRDNRVCEDCLRRPVPWPGVLHKCYRQSRLGSTTVAVMLTLHRSLRTFSTYVDAYIALTEFARLKVIEGGLSPQKVYVKPNFLLDDPGKGSHLGGYALFVGRLSEEKGVSVLLEAWHLLDLNLPLRIVGDGPLIEKVATAAQHDRRIEYLGRLPRDEVRHQMREATLLIVPSVWYEAFPMVIVEAYACGLPVVGSKIGSLDSLIEDDIQGIKYPPGNPESLAESINYLVSRPNKLAEMSVNARRTYEDNYNADANYNSLMHIYSEVLSK